MLAIASRDWNGRIDSQCRIIEHGTEGWFVNVWGQSCINPPHRPGDFAVWQDDGEVFSNVYYGPEVYC